MKEDLERALKAARQELEKATKALAPKHQGGEWERFRAAHEKCLSLEREVARSAGDECAVEIDWPAPWDAGAPLPHVIASRLRTRLVYRLRDQNTNFDGSTVTLIDPAAPARHPIAVVEFRHCCIHRFGMPNDEALVGHRLYGRGLVAYGAHTVERSRWLHEVERMNSVHPQHRPETFRDYIHFVLAFHDETFECLAKSFVVRDSHESFAEALQRCALEVIE
jgi:hypothetical protein